MKLLVVSILLAAAVQTSAPQTGFDRILSQLQGRVGVGTARFDVAADDGRVRKVIHLVISSTKPKDAQYGHDNHDQANQVNDAVHGIILRLLLTHKRTAGGLVPYGCHRITEIMPERAYSVRSASTAVPHEISARLSE